MILHTIPTMSHADVQLTKQEIDDNFSKLENEPIISPETINFIKNHAIIRPKRLLNIYFRLNIKRDTLLLHIQEDTKCGRAENLSYYNIHLFQITEKIIFMSKFMSDNNIPCVCDGQTIRHDDLKNYALQQANTIKTQIQNNNPLYQNKIMLLFEINRFAHSINTIL